MQTLARDICQRIKHYARTCLHQSRPCNERHASHHHHHWQALAYHIVTIARLPSQIAYTIEHHHRLRRLHRTFSLLTREIFTVCASEKGLLSNCVSCVKCQHNQAPAYLSDQLQQVSQVCVKTAPQIIKYVITRRPTDPKIDAWRPSVSSFRRQSMEVSVCRQPPLQLCLLSTEP